VYDNSLVSIIVPVYNSEKYLDKCITSILTQTYKNIELILINDGSSDNSGYLCDAYANMDHRIKVMHVKNSGVSSARNSGIEVATGKFIEFVDSDDYIEQNMVETLVNEINVNVDIVICGYKRLYKDSNGIIVAKNSKLYNEVAITKNKFLHGIGNLFVDFYINYLWNKLYVRDIIKKYNIKFDNSINWGEDLMFNLEYLGYCKNITIMDKPLYNYINYNNDSLTSKFNSELFNNQQTMYKAMREFLDSNNEYFGQNKELVETRFTDAIIMCLGNLFCSDTNYKKTEVKNKISQIIENDIVRKNLKYFAYGGIQKKIIGRMIENKSLNLIFYYFTTKNHIRDKTKSIYKILKIHSNFKLKS